MQLLVYKGFSTSFLNKLDTEPLLESDINGKKNVFSFDMKRKKRLAAALLNMDDEDEKWVTYEEFAYSKEQIEAATKEFCLKVTILRNNLYPDYYPIEFNITDSQVQEIQTVLQSESEKQEEISEECSKFLEIYNSIIRIDDVLYGSFYNYEYDNSNGSVTIQNVYPCSMEYRESADPLDCEVFLNEDIESYLHALARIQKDTPPKIGFRTTDGMTARRMLKSLMAYCQQKGIALYHHSETLMPSENAVEELIDIARNEIRIPHFKDFRRIKFYKNPDVDNSTVEISQSQIIGDIIMQAESSYSAETDHKFRDIFITAPTGAGKSVMFQVPAVYLAKKYHKLTIIIEPVKALMQDQKEQLNDRGYERVEVFNSDLISQAEKEAVLKKVKDGDVDLFKSRDVTFVFY